MPGSQITRISTPGPQGRRALRSAPGAAPLPPPPRRPGLGPDPGGVRRRRELAVECAWVGKEAFCDLYRAPDGAAAKAALDDWYDLVERYDVAELNTFARTIAQWELQFLNYFDSRATNARSEARNLIIKQVKRSGFGFRRFDHYRLRVLYRCG